MRNLRAAKQHTDIEIEVSPRRDNIANIPKLIDFALSENVPIKLDDLRTRRPKLLPAESIARG